MATQTSPAAPASPKNIITAKTFWYAVGTGAAVAAAPQLAAAVAAKPVLAVLLNSLAVFLLRLTTNKPVAFNAPLSNPDSGASN